MWCLPRHSSSTLIDLSAKPPNSILWDMPNLDVDYTRHQACDAFVMSNHHQNSVGEISCFLSLITCCEARSWMNLDLDRGRLLCLQTCRAVEYRSLYCTCVRRLLFRGSWCIQPWARWMLNAPRTFPAHQTHNISLFVRWCRSTMLAMTVLSSDAVGSCWLCARRGIRHVDIVVFH